MVEGAAECARLSGLQKNKSVLLMEVLVRSCRKDMKWLSRIAFHCVMANNFRFNMQMSAKEKYLAWHRLIYSIIGSRAKIKTTTGWWWGGRNLL